MAEKEKREVGDALGLVETRGLIGMIEAADAMVKTANVIFVGWQKVDAGLVTAIVGGDGASVTLANLGVNAANAITGGATNLNDKFPWGIWIGFDILCGVGLAAGGFTLVAVVHIFNIEKYHPILRPSILTAFLGYLLVVFALLFDLGRPDRLWHPLVMWNPHSVMLEVAWCVTLYTTVLALEFVPVVLEKFELHQSLKVVRAISVPLMIAGVILSTLHQS